MKLFSLLLILAWERLFKTGERWQLDHWLQGLWPKIRRPSLVTSFALWLGVVMVTLLYLWLIRGHLFGLLTLLSWIALGLCASERDINGVVIMLFDGGTPW